MLPQTWLLLWRCRTSWLLYKIEPVSVDLWGQDSWVWYCDFYHSFVFLFAIHDLKLKQLMLLLIPWLWILGCSPLSPTVFMKLYSDWDQYQYKIFLCYPSMSPRWIHKRQTDSFSVILLTNSGRTTQFWKECPSGDHYWHCSAVIYSFYFEIGGQMVIALDRSLL